MTGTVRRAIAVVRTALILALALSGAAQAQSFRFTSFEVQGNERFDDGTVLNNAGIAPGETVTGGDVNDALQRLQNTGLFETVEIDPRGSTLVVIVQEYPTINRIAIEGNRRLDDDALLPLIDSQSRRVYSPSTAETDAEAIAGAYAQDGRLAATVTPVIIRRSDNRVDLVFEVTEGQVVETERIAFVGNRNFSDYRLRQVIESTQAGIFRQIIGSDTFIPERLDFDEQLLTDFYRERGYVDFTVQSIIPEVSRERDAFFVTFNIVEGQSYDFGEISVATDLDAVDVDAYRAEIRIRPGVTYSPRLVDNTIERLENLATAQGLRFVRVEPRITRNDESLTLDVEFAVIRGPRVFVERIDIEGNQTTLDRVIRRQFDTVEGDPFDPRRIRAAAERIRALGFFANVGVEPRQGASADQVVVDVDVEEQPTGSLGFGVNYSTDSGTGLAINFSERNFLGRGQAVSFGFDTSDGAQSVNLRFREPAFLRRDLALGVNAFYNTTSQQFATYNTTRAGVGASLGFPTSENGRLTLSYGLSYSDLFYDDASDEADASDILAADVGEYIVSEIGWTYAYDTRNSGLDPDSGVLLRVGQDLAGLGGDVEYIRTTALAVGETRVLNDDVRLTAAFEAGGLSYLSGDSRLPDRFFLSTRQLRGFEPRGLGPRDLNATNQDALGGNYFAVARFEAQFPLGLPEEYGLSGGVYYDVGTVWGLDNVVGEGGNAVDDDLYLRQTVGAALFWDTAIGPLRFNFSHVLDAQDYDETRSFDFTIQTEF